MFDHYDVMLFAYVARAIGDDWQWGDEVFKHNKALLIGIALFTSGIGGVVFGGLADRFGRRRVMGWTILIYSLSTGLSGLAVGLVSLAILRAMTGFGFGGEWATGQALLAEVFPKERRGLASALLQAGQPVGAILAIWSGLWLEPHVGWRVVFMLGAAPAALVVFLRRYVPESRLWLAQQDRPRPGFVEQYVVLLRDHWRRTLLALVLGISKLGDFLADVRMVAGVFPGTRKTAKRDRRRRHSVHPTELSTLGSVHAVHRHAALRRLGRSSGPTTDVHALRLADGRRVTRDGPAWSRNAARTHVVLVGHDGGRLRLGLHCWLRSAAGRIVPNVDPQHRHGNDLQRLAHPSRWSRSC